jgi:hypothetical protein
MTGKKTGNRLGIAHAAAAAGGSISTASVALNEVEGARVSPRPATCRRSGRRGTRTRAR